MITRKQIDTLEQLIGQLDSLHDELTALSKKSPNDAVNSFKLKFINDIITKCNDLLSDVNKPLADFNLFNPDDVPSNSDVTFIISLYISSLEKFRSNNIKVSRGSWVYDTGNTELHIITTPPAKLKRK